MKLVKRTKVSDWNTQGEYSSQSFPSVAVTPMGRIVVSWRSARKKDSVIEQCVLLSWSDDAGITWSKPQACFTPPALEGRPGCFRSGQLSAMNGQLLMHLAWIDCSHPERPFFNEENSGLLDCKIFLSESVDEGESWSKPRLLDTSPFSAQPTPITGPVLAFPDGELISQFELNKPYDSPEPWRHLPVLNFSRDGGASFYRHAIPAQCPDNHTFYWDQRPIILKDGNSIVDFFWTWDNVRGVYHNISMAFSTDRGRSWRPLHDTGISGQPGQPVEFSNGALLLPLVDRTEEPRIMARLTYDRGQSFTEECLELSNRQSQCLAARQETLIGAWNEMTNFSLGLPAGIGSGRDTAYVVWYAGMHTDRTDIEFAEVSLE